MSWKEFGGYPLEKFGGDGIEVIRMLHGPWEDRKELLENDDYIQYPEIEGLTLQSVEFEPWPECPTLDPSDRSQTINAYEEVKATLTYSTPQNINSGSSGGRSSQEGFDQVTQDIDGISFYTIDVNGDIEVDYLKGAGKYKWDNVPANLKLPLNYSKKIRIPFIDIRVTRNNWREPEWESLGELIGTVNKNNWEIPVMDILAPQDTIYFSTYSATFRTDFSQLGIPRYTWDVSYHMQYRWLKRQKRVTSGGDVVSSGTSPEYAIGWNHFFCEGLGAWDRILHVDISNPDERYYFPRVNWDQYL